MDINKNKIHINKWINKLILTFSTSIPISISRIFKSLKDITTRGEEVTKPNLIKASGSVNSWIAIKNEKPFPDLKIDTPFCCSLLLCDFLADLLFEFACLTFCFLPFIFDFYVSLFDMFNLFSSIFFLPLPFVKCTYGMFSMS